MSRSRRTTDVLLRQFRGEAGGPFLPWLGTTIFSFGTDPDADGRAVVLGLPAGPESKSSIQVVTRTSQSVPDIGQPADLSLSLNKDGVFADLASIEQHLSRPCNVLLLGILLDPSPWSWSGSRDRP